MIPLLLGFENRVDDGGVGSRVGEEATEGVSAVEGVDRGDGELSDVGGRDGDILIGDDTSEDGI